MKRDRQSSNEQLALASLVGIIVLSGVGISATLAQIPGAPVGAVVPYGGSLFALSSVVLLLLWWRHIGGYIGSMGLGIAVLIGSVFGVIGSLLVHRVDDVPAEIVLLGLSVVLIFSSRGAWREKQNSD